MGSADHPKLSSIHRSWLAEKGRASLSANQRCMWEGRKIALCQAQDSGLCFRVLYKKTPARNNSLELNMAQLKGKGTVTTVSSPPKSASVMWRTIEIDSTIPWGRGWRRGTGWLWGRGRKKEAAVPLGLQTREDIEVCRVNTGTPFGEAFLTPMGSGVQRPHHQDPLGTEDCFSHQLTMGSTSASRSNSSWISSVLPESLLATELGEGEFLEGREK